MDGDIKKSTTVNCPVTTKTNEKPTIKYTKPKAYIKIGSKSSKSSKIRSDVRVHHGTKASGTKSTGRNKPKDEASTSKNNRK